MTRQLIERETFDSSGMERSPFDGRYTPLPSGRSPHRAMRHHGPDCSSNPEVGCACGEEERHYLRLERREARFEPNAAAEGVLR